MKLYFKSYTDYKIYTDGFIFAFCNFVWAISRAYNVYKKENQMKEMKA